MALVDELSDAEVDEALERFDQTDEHLKRRVIAELFLQKTLGSKWQPIETAPKDGTRLILWGREDGVGEPRVWLGSWSTGCWYAPSWVAYEHRSETEYLQPTHWMPVPEPPVTA